jgi:hypothetical protein
MRLLPHFLARRDRRATLRELHYTGILSIYRSHSVLRLWEPLREHPSRQHDFEE